MKAAGPIPDDEETLVGLVRVGAGSAPRVDNALFAAPLVVGELRRTVDGFDISASWKNVALGPRVEGLVVGPSPLAFYVVPSRRPLWVPVRGTASFIVYRTAKPPFGCQPLPHRRPHRDGGPHGHQRGPDRRATCRQRFWIASVL